MSCFVQQIFAIIKPQSCLKTEQMWKFFAPNFFRKGRPQIFYGELLAQFTVHRLAEFGWVPFADLRFFSAGCGAVEQFCVSVAKVG